MQLWAFLVFGLTVRALAAGLLGASHDSLEVSPLRIDVNRAGLHELAVLPGIGPARAEAMILFRVRHGPFPSLDAVAAVDGCGPGTVEGLRPYAYAGVDRR